MSANQTKKAINAHQTQVDASTYAQRQRLRTIARVSLCLVLLEAFSNFLPMGAKAREGALVMALIASLIGIAAALWLWRLDSKQ